MMWCRATLWYRDEPPAEVAERLLQEARGCSVAPETARVRLGREEDGRSTLLVQFRIRRQPQTVAVDKFFDRLRDEGYCAGWLDMSMGFVTAPASGPPEPADAGAEQ